MKAPKRLRSSRRARARATSGEASPYFVFSHSIDPASELAYGDPPPEDLVYGPVEIYGEWEPDRPLPGDAVMPEGFYNLMLVLTEESFHSNLPLGGFWASVLFAPTVSFVVGTPPDPPPARGRSAPSRRIPPRQACRGASPDRRLSSLLRLPPSVPESKLFGSGSFFLTERDSGDLAETCAPFTKDGEESLVGKRALGEINCMDDVLGIE